MDRLPLGAADLSEALSSSDLFALVSENENFGMVVIEAMLCGLPVMVSKDVGVAEYIKDQPFVILVDRTVEAITHNLLLFSQQDIRDREIIRKIAVERFDPEIIAKQFANAMKKDFKSTGDTLSQKNL